MGLFLPILPVHFIMSDGAIQVLRRDMNGVARLVADSMTEQGCCSHCQGQHIVKNGTTHGTARLLCRDCGKTFSALTGTQSLSPEQLLMQTLRP